MEKISLLILIVACFELVTLPQVTCLTSSPQVPSTFFRSRLALKTTNYNKKKAHFVLVHGGGHGAWCWYKLMALLETAGHNATALDLAGSGISPKQLKDVVSLQDYAEPLMEVMDSIPDGEKVVLVGHSLGGLSMALAMEAFAEKISVAVFVAAVLVPPNSTLHQFFSKPFKGVSGCMYDTKFSYGEHGPTSVLFGPQMLAHRLYQQSPLEDLKLATVLSRETRTFTKDTTADARFTRERYGSVPRVFAFCGEDKISIKDELQSMIDEAGVEEVDVIEGADHMAMLSKPQELFSYLLDIVEKYA